MDEKDIPGVDESQENRDIHMVDRSKTDEDDRMSERKDDSLEQDDPKPRPTSLQQKMLAMAGQDIDQFMKEVGLNMCENSMSIYCKLILIMAFCRWKKFTRKEKLIELPILKAVCKLWSRKIMALKISVNLHQLLRQNLLERHRPI